MSKADLTTAIILAGGPASRLRPLSENIPKGLVMIVGKSLLDWIVEWLKNCGIRHVILGVAHHKEKIIKHFGDGSKYDLQIEYSTHTIEGGTAEGFRLAIERYVNDENFFAMNGDQIVNLSLSKLSRFHISNRSIATIVGGHARCDFGHLLMDKDQNLVGFLEKPVCNYVYINTGIYAFNRRIINYLPKKGDVERTVFPELAKKKRVKIFPYEGKFLTINTNKDLLEAKVEMKNWRHV